MGYICKTYSKWTRQDASIFYKELTFPCLKNHHHHCNLLLQFKRKTYFHIHFRVTRIFLIRTKGLGIFQLNSNSTFVCLFIYYRAHLACSRQNCMKSYSPSRRYKCGLMSALLRGQRKCNSTNLREELDVSKVSITQFCTQDSVPKFKQICPVLDPLYTTVLCISESWNK